MTQKKKLNSQKKTNYNSASQEDNRNHHCIFAIAAGYQVNTVKPH